MIKSYDPLKLLKDTIGQNKKIQRDGEYLHFGEGIRLKIDTPTALRRIATKDQITIGEIWFLLSHQTGPLKELIELSREEGINLIYGVEKPKIIDYFINGIEDIDILDNELIPKTQIFLGKKRKEDPFLEEISPEIAKRQNQIEKAKHYAKIKKNKEQLDPKLLTVDYIYSNTKRSLNRNTWLKPIGNTCSFDNVLSFCRQVFTLDGTNKQHSEKVSFLEELMSSEDLSLKAIIIVPSSFVEGNLCIENAKEFLEDANYINLNSLSAEERKKLAHNNTFKKKILGRELSFEICDNVRNFTKSEWKRVVSIFVQGDSWEFKDWPLREDVTTILQKIKGFHLKFKDLPTNPNVKKWNVQILEIDRNKRHYDASIQNEFWSIMTKFLSQQRKR